MSRAAPVIAALILFASGSVFNAALAAGDPTRPPGLRAPGGGAGAPAARPRWRLNATLISPERRSAMINGRTVVVGQRINGARVLSIQPAMVRLRGKHGEFNIYLHGRVRIHKKPTVKQPS
ncbi:MAG TPA: hypothetical protein ENJ01_12425 [Gammaproteobacteria bacterium]|nr:hypothetical protein [Gammaproteobacteria bacterium]